MGIPERNDGMKPVIFDQTIGWLHPAPSGRGVVIAGAQGFEDLCSRRFLTVLAKQLAEAGLPVLQFDYPGCGDAAGDYTQPAQVAAWTRSIGAAIDTLKAEAPVTDVLVIGFRLGALLAPAAIAGRSDVAGIALLAPPMSGRSYMREMTGLSRMVDAVLPPYPAATPFDGIEAAGFRMSAETATDLRTLVWEEALNVSPGLDLLLMSPQPTVANKDLVQRVANAGGTARLETFEGFERLMSKPGNDIPQSPLSIIADWAAHKAVPQTGTRAPAGISPSELVGDGYRELPHMLDGSPAICGILCLPDDRPQPDEVTLILNAGAIPHIGWARGTVDMARSLARQGIASMRVDLPGFGQSDAPADGRIPLYDERTRHDVSRTVDWLESQGFEHVCAVGTCSGAFQSFHAARHDPRISDVVMVNPLCFSWNSSYALDVGLSNIRDNAENKPSSRTDETSGISKPSTVKVGKRAVRQFLELSKSVLLLWGALTGNSVESRMTDMTKRGTRVLVVSCEDDLSLQEIARHFGPSGERLKRMSGVSTALIPAADHTLTPLHAREQLAGLVAEFSTQRG